ncbi:MAG: hypothetical protein HUJ96_02295 [Marinilabiliaceae bacterium]|nr:hypothetical protein [Marinilabiliaceae bacterium]
MKPNIFKTGLIPVAALSLSACANVGMVSSNALTDDLYYSTRSKSVPVASASVSAGSLLNVQDIDSYDKRVSEYGRGGMNYVDSSRDFSDLQVSNGVQGANKSTSLQTDETNAEEIVATEADGVWVDGFWGSDSDRSYAERMIRFHGPFTTVTYYSPVFTHARYSGDWNIYVDNRGYAYFIPRWSNPWYDDYYYGYGWNWSWHHRHLGWGYYYGWDYGWDYAWGHYYGWGYPYDYWYGWSPYYHHHHHHHHHYWGMGHGSHYAHHNGFGVNRYSYTHRNGTTGRNISAVRTSNRADRMTGGRRVTSADTYSRSYTRPASSTRSVTARSERSVSASSSVDVGNRTASVRGSNQRSTSRSTVRSTSATTQSNINSSAGQSRSRTSSAVRSSSSTSRSNYTASGSRMRGTVSSGSNKSSSVGSNHNTSSYTQSRSSSSYSSPSRSSSSYSGSSRSSSSHSSGSRSGSSGGSRGGGGRSGGRR